MSRASRYVLAATAFVVCATAIGAANLAANPGVEDGDGAALAEWIPSCTGGSTAERDPAQAFSGKACGHIVKVNDGKSHVAALAFPRIDVTPGGTYALSGWARGHVPVGTALLFLYQYDKDGHYLGQGLHSAVPQDTDRWTPLRQSAKLLDTCAYVQLRFEIYGNESRGEAWVDDVFFGPDAPGPGPVRNLTARADGGSARLTWDAPQGVAAPYYLVYRSPYPRFVPTPPAIVGTSHEPRFDDPLPRRSAYYMVVAADEALSPSPPVIAGPVLAPGVPAEPRVAIWTSGPGHRVDEALPDKLPSGPLPIAFEAARGEYENAQLFVGAPRETLRGVEVRLSALTGPKGAAVKPEAHLFLEEYVDIPSLARRAADPLVPPRAVDIAPGLLRGWWVQVYVPQDCPPGDYRGMATVLVAGRKTSEAPITVHVWPIDEPQGNHYAGAWGIWADQIAQQEGVHLAWSEEPWRDLYRRYMRFFLDHRMVPRETPPLVTDESIAWVRSPQVSAYALPWTFSRLPTDAEARGFDDTYRVLRSLGVLGKGFVYISDEPDEKDYPNVVALCKRLREVAADVKILLTEQPEPALYGSVDIWCPLTSIFATDVERCRERQKLGEHVWWYVACGPTPPWPNYLLTNDLIDARVLSWQQVKYGVEGELYWAVTCFPGDVWREAMGIQPGDGYLCYPGRPRGLDGPVTCARAEVIRDAKEDIELIWLLRDIASRRGKTAEAEQVVQRAIGLVTTDLLHYAKDDATIRDARRLLAAEIAKLATPR